VPAKFNIIGNREVNNFEMAEMVSSYVGKPLYYELVDFHSSRPGHDLRYALDGDKIAATGWKAPLSLEESLERTVKWTLAHPEWLTL
jgi:dTDP-glucose 4,6-dehydratase